MRSPLHAATMAVFLVGPSLFAQDTTRAAPPSEPVYPPAACAVRVDTIAPPDSILVPGAPLIRTPSPLRGLYVSRWAAVGQKMWQLIDVAKRTEVNALVLDTMRAHGIYPIARIVVVKDPVLARKKPEWSIKRARDQRPWLDKTGNPWLDPHQRGPWQYAVDLACEAIDLGFSEVQYDYVRFPDEKRLVAEASFPLARGRDRASVIRDQLRFVRGSLRPYGVPVTAD